MSVLPPATPPAPKLGAPARSRQMQILWVAVVVIVVALVLRACAHHENTYEKLAHQLTEAVQRNDLPAVQKLENSETAVDMTRARLGRAADVLSPLGKVERVREVAAPGAAARVHEFDVRFEKGTVHEQIQFDPDDKVFHFHYDPPAK